MIDDNCIYSGTFCDAAVADDAKALVIDVVFDDVVDIRTEIAKNENAIAFDVLDDDDEPLRGKRNDRSTIAVFDSIRFDDSILLQ